MESDHIQPTCLSGPYDRASVLTADHNVQRIAVHLQRFRFPIRQLHQSSASRVLCFLCPSFVHENVQSCFNLGYLQCFTSRREQRDLQNALSEVFLHDGLYPLIRVFARMLGTKKEAVNQEWNEAIVAQKQVFCGLPRQQVFLMVLSN